MRVCGDIPLILLIPGPFQAPGDRLGTVVSSSSSGTSLALLSLVDCHRNLHVTHTMRFPRSRLEEKPCMAAFEPVSSPLKLGTKCCRKLPPPSDDLTLENLCPRDANPPRTGLLYHINSTINSTALGTRCRHSNQQLGRQTHMVAWMTPPAPPPT